MLSYLVTVVNVRACSTTTVDQPAQGDALSSAVTSALTLADNLQSACNRSSQHQSMKRHTTLCDQTGEDCSLVILYLMKSSCLI